MKTTIEISVDQMADIITRDDRIWHRAIITLDRAPGDIIKRRLVSPDKITYMGNDVFVLVIES